MFVRLEQCIEMSNVREGLGEEILSFNILLFYVFHLPLITVLISMGSLRQEF